MYLGRMSEAEINNLDFPSSSDQIDSGSPGRRIKPQRRIVRPVVLFVLTLFSTFWVGVSQWSPNVLSDLLQLMFTGNLLPFRMAFLAHWDTGLTYMGAVMLIIFLHEMGHFVASLYYRVPTSLPYFLPFPANPIGTLGAVIILQGNEADRKQIFDIGIAGPLAGLVAAVPIAFYGVSLLDLTSAPTGGFGFRMPWLLDWFAHLCHVPGYQTGSIVWLNQLNPWFVAGWVGFLITGINMMPVGQLDGGHVTYTLFGKTAHTIAQLTLVFAIAFMVYHNDFVLGLMVVLLLLSGPNHPPTSDDGVAIGSFRFGLGLFSLVIPILCFPPQVFKILM